MASDEDFALLRERILSVARPAAVRDGFVVPTAAAVLTDGAYAPIASPVVTTPQQMLDELFMALKTLTREKKARAVGWCVDMRIEPKGRPASDAIVVFTEGDGRAEVLFQPYRGAELGATWVEPGTAEVF
jgi:hypothetical protein